MPMIGSGTIGKFRVADTEVTLLHWNVMGGGGPFRNQSRLPFLGAIDQICRDAAGAGRSFDVVAGDFNTPSRSIGFDALTAQGYTLASRAASGWRGTFPAWLPVYDIDHV